MIRGWFLALCAGLFLAADAPAQTAWRFRLQPGQVLTYRVEQATTATETTAGNKEEKSTTKLSLLKRWQVLDVDNAGTATIQKSLLAMRLETTLANGEVLLFDSADPEKSNAQLREQLSGFVNTPLAVLRIDARGQVLEVKESRFGPASRFESEPPFLFTLPEAEPQPGQAWERTYQITLEPPMGTGEKYAAVQRCACKEAAGATATVTLATALKTLPESVADRVPLLQMQPEGEIVFDVQAGCVRSASLRIDKELTGHQGEGSRYHFQSVYTEELVGNK
jgi:hypothetical protein